MRDARLKWVLLALAVWLGAPALAQEARDAGRDAWQRPTEVMEALGVREGFVVADIGCGRGYFTAHLARRVGASGAVYAVDVDEKALEQVRRLMERNNFHQVRIVRGNPDDPRLPPASLDVALIVDSYHEFRQADAMLEKIFTALKPGGLLGIIDRAIEPGETRNHYWRRHRIPKELVQEDAARRGFLFVREASGFIRPRDSLALYFLIFERPPG